MWKDFKPTISFLVKFLGLYVCGNLLYGTFVTNFAPQPDPVTAWVSRQAGVLLTSCYEPVNIREHSEKPTVLVVKDENAVISVYEGCNGANVMIIFVAFVLSFGSWNKSALWFLPAGILFIHCLNLGRIILLYYVTRNFPSYLYFTHKYLFTAVLYAGVFLLWWLWIKYVRSDIHSK